LPVLPLAPVVCANAGAAAIASATAPVNTYCFIDASSVMQKASQG
jgi:hypothetical protein